MTSGRPDSEPGAPADPAGLSRRVALKRIAAAGTVVWAAPVLSTVMAPVSAASAPGGGGGGTANCADPCSNPVICGNLGPNGTCIQYQLVDGSGCWCGQVFDQTFCDTQATVCSNDADCSGLPGTRCVKSCCTDVTGSNTIAICVSC
jgi:hypothetical protein